MKKDLLIAALLIGMSALGLGLAALVSIMYSDVQTETVRPKTESYAHWKKVEPAVKPTVAKAKPKVVVAPKAAPVVLEEIAEPIAMPREKTAVVEAKKIEPPNAVKKLPEKKISPDAKVIVLEPNIKLNDPDGEYTLKAMNAGKEAILLGIIKTLKITSVGDRAFVDATRLDAQEIVFLGNLNTGAKVLLGNARVLKIEGVNGGSLIDATRVDADSVVIAGDLNNSKVLLGNARTLKFAGANADSLIDASKIDADEVNMTGNLNHSKVLLGKAKKLTIGHLNDRSTFDGSKLDARSIVVRGALNGGSILMLHAPGGSIQLNGPVNDRSQIDIVAPEGKVIFNVRGAAIITGDAKLTLLAKELHLQGQIHGAQTHLNVTLTKDGFLAFERLNQGVRLHYRKADAADPEPRVNKGIVDAKAELRSQPAAR